MIFDTLLPHARVLTENEDVGERCFLLDRCRFAIDQFNELFVQNSELAKPKSKLDLPILLFGRTLTAIPGRFQGNNSGNASNSTFKRKKTKDDFPTEWFPWLWSEKNSMQIHDLLSLMQKFNDASPETVYELFTLNGSLFTFQPHKRKKTDDEALTLEGMVEGSVYQPVTCNKPTLAVHSVLALNALNEKAGLFGETKDLNLIRKELFKFCLLFWMLNQINSLEITTAELEKGVKVEPKISVAGNVGNISALPLLLDAGNFHLGVHTSKVVYSHPIIEKFLSLTCEENVDRISLTRANKIFTAPATGKAPTNAYRRMDGLNALAPQVMLGFDRNDVSYILPAYSNIIQDKAFSLSRTNLNYYVFPEEVSLTFDYLEFLSDMISRLNGYKQDYFDWLSKSSSSVKAKEEKQKALVHIQEQRKALWEKSWSTQFKLCELLFAFEENVGSSNQAQFTWTSVYRHLPAAKAFLFLEMVDDPTSFGRLTTFLRNSSFNLSESWKEKEVKHLFDRYFSSSPLSQIEFWMRWRKYLIRSNLAEAPIDPNLWENAMSVIIQIKAMKSLTVDTNWTGKEIMKNLAMRRKTMDEENQSSISKYLRDFFLPGILEQIPVTEKGMIKVKQFIEQQAKNYSAFVDAESESWRTIVDGLICGWALKQICSKIRRDDYKSVIGGKSLAKHTPAQLRSLSIDLCSKAERAGATPWNVQAPLERMFKWSQKNPHTPEVLLFMDAVSLGFMRYDKQNEAATDDAIDDNKNQGSEQ